MSRQKKSKNKLKIFTIVSCIVLAAVVIANTARFGYIYTKQKNAEKELAATIETTVADGKAVMEKFGIEDKQQQYIDCYETNMQNSTTVLQRAYIADAFLTFAANDINTRNSENVSDIYKNGTIGQSRTYLVEQLNGDLSKLRAAISSYTVYKEN